MPDSKALPDLAEVIENCKSRIDAIDTSMQVTISSEKADSLMDAYKELNPKHSIELVGGHTFAIGTGEQTRHISIQEMTTLAVLAENLRALESFRVSLDDIAHEMGFSSRVGDGSEFFGTMPSEDWQSNTSQNDTDKFMDSLNNTFEDQQNRERMLKFVSDPDWSGMRKDDGTIGRKLNRSTDWQESAILKTGALVAAASAGRVNLIRAIEQAGFGADLVEIKTLPSVLSTIVGENVIFYGAPGTGKSNRVEQKIKEAGKRPFRTVFHPDLQNSDFFGCLKPQMDGKKVRYGFSPGPFMKALSEAYREPSEPVFLVIEELNRAAAAAVFGDLFLLLDRDDDGRGEYDVSFPSPESEQWFEAETGTAHKALRLPSNLFIYATMNSADQGVYPLDTAFRRRWKQKYLPLDYKSGRQGAVGYVDAVGDRRSLAWREFVKLLNRQLTKDENLDIAEDRLLGQWFVSEPELNGKSIPEKVLIYLWDDVLRHEGRKGRELIFAAGKENTYGELASKIERGECILSDPFLAVLNAASDVTAAEPEESAEDAS